MHLLCFCLTVHLLCFCFTFYIWVVLSYDQSFCVSVWWSIFCASALWTIHLSCFCSTIHLVCFGSTIHLRCFAFTIHLLRVCFTTILCASVLRSEWGVALVVTISSWKSQHASTLEVVKGLYRLDVEFFAKSFWMYIAAVIHWFPPTVSSQTIPGSCVFVLFYPQTTLLKGVYRRVAPLTFWKVRHGCGRLLMWGSHQG